MLIVLQEVLSINTKYNMTCCFTGHRKIPQESYNQIYRQTEITIEKLINSGYTYFGTGGALGFDTLAALLVLRFKKQYSHIRLILVLPCRQQTFGWTKRDIEIYENIKLQADKVVYTSDEYYSGCMHKRNRHLVDNSSACICYLTEHTGGTAYTVNYAKGKNLKIINVATLF